MSVTLVPVVLAACAGELPTGPGDVTGESTDFFLSDVQVTTESEIQIYWDTGFGVEQLSVPTDRLFERTRDESFRRIQPGDLAPHDSVRIWVDYNNDRVKPSNANTLLRLSQG